MGVITTLSRKGQVVLPRLVRSRLHLTPGTRFQCLVHGGSVVLTPEMPQKRVKKYITDPATGLRVTKAHRGAEPVTSDMVRALLEGFP